MQMQSQSIIREINSPVLIRNSCKLQWLLQVELRKAGSLWKIQAHSVCFLRTRRSKLLEITLKISKVISNSQHLRQTESRARVKMKDNQGSYVESSIANI